MYPVEIAPKGGGPGPHFHRAMSEAFFLLSGTVKLSSMCRPGGIHGFRNEADEPTTILMLFAPGAPRENYFEGMAKPGEISDDERREWFIKNDNFFIE